jgi:cation:H+ antiporter
MPGAATRSCSGTLPGIMTALYFSLSFLLILVCAELFTNAVEWAGRRFNLDEGATGSVLAAVGTALPETMVPLMALITLGGEGGSDIGIGAIMGAPFMLSSLAMFVTGVAVIAFSFAGRRTPHVVIREKIMRRDLSHFLIAYLAAMVAGLLHITALNWILAALLLVFYGYYVWETMRGEGSLEGECEALWFHRRCEEEPHTWRIVVQLLVALGGIVWGAQVFVEQVEVIANSLGAAPLLVALLIAPVATELPEKFNSVIWIGRNKDPLALGNITGAMVFQSTFPVSIGLLFTEWRLPFYALVSGILALFSGLVFYLIVRLHHRLPWWTLVGAGSMYVAYVLMVLFVL